MQQPDQSSKLESLILELEKRYSYFKKIDIFKAVNNAYKKVHPLFQQFDSSELEEIKNLAVSDLSF